MQEKDSKFPHIIYSCYSNKSNEGEQFVPSHILAFTISGTSDLYVAGKNHVLREGDFTFFRKNQLCRFTKFPPPGGEYRSISISIDQDTLLAIGEERDLQMQNTFTGQGILRLKPVPLLTNFIASLTPYLDTESDFNAAITPLKVREAVMILLETNPQLKNVLFDFSDPGKLDLEAYMNEHYKFNVDLNRFAYLTGRSLATFKRDFEKTFHSTPNRWLQQKRLTEAYYLIKEKKLKSSDVYLEVGFKDLSHFSFAFKKAYGIAPSSLS